MMIGELTQFDFYRIHLREECFAERLVSQMTVNREAER